MNYNTLLLTTTEIGFQLLKNGAETYRVEDSITHVLKAYSDKLSDINIFAIPTCLIVSFTTQEGITYTKQKRVLNRLQNIDRIIQINSLCRYISKNVPELEYIDSELRKIENQGRYSYNMELVAFAVCACVFTLFYGGGFRDAGIGFILGGVLKLTTSLLKKFQMNSFTTIMFNSFIIASLALFSYQLGFAGRYDSIIIGCYMLLVPGVAITNSARDFIAGDVLSGTIRLVEAFLVATSIALGSGLALAIFR